MGNIIQVRRGTAALATSVNPILHEGEIGLETDGLLTSPKLKIGDGTTVWSSLPYFGMTGTTWQPLDSDLTTIAGLTATTDNFLVSVASAWASRTPSQVRTTLGLIIGTNVQAFDSDLTTIAGLTATTDNFMVSVASAWASRTPSQVKTTLALNNVDNTSDANKPVSTATQTALDAKFDKLPTIITPTILAADTNNYNPTSFSTAFVVKISSSLDIILSGLIARTSGTQLQLINVGAFDIYLNREDTNSSASNRFTIADAPNGVSTYYTVLKPDGILTLIYDGTSSRWRVQVAVPNYIPESSQNKKSDFTDIANVASFPNLQAVADYVSIYSYVSKGIASLVNGVVTINDATIDANSIIVISIRQSAGTGLGVIGEDYSSRVIGTSFTVQSAMISLGSVAIQILDQTEFYWFMYKG